MTDVSKKELASLIKSIIDAEFEERQQNADTHVDHILSCPGCWKEFEERIKDESEFFDCPGCETKLPKKAYYNTSDPCPECGRR